MTESPAKPTTPEPLEGALTGADDRLLLNHWLPPQEGIVPRVRIGQRWISVLWALPIGAAALIVLIAIAQSLRELPERAGVHQAISGHRPGRTVGRLRLSLVAAASAFRQHVLHAVHHPGRHPDPGRSPAALLEAGLHAGNRLVPLPGSGPERAGVDLQGRFRHHSRHGWAFPGVRHSLGLARWWHFSVNLLWVINGVLFYALLFSTDQWRRLVPMTWGVFPAALSTAIQYASLNFPVDHSWTRYNGLQQLSYFVTVFIAAPVSIATGPDAEPGDLEQAGLVRKGVQPAGDAVGPFPLVRLVRAVHPGARDHGVRHRPAAKHQPHVRRRR